MADSFEYRYRAGLEIISGGYYQEIKGVQPPSTDQTSSSPTDSFRYQYFFHDSNSGTNENSSRVTIDCEDSWTVERQSDNSLKVTVTTTIHSCQRTLYRGDPRFSDRGLQNATRDIRVTSQDRSITFISVNNDDVGTNHSIPIQRSSATHTYYIEPGGSAWRGSLHVHAWVTGYESYGEDYNDEMDCGVIITNILPRDFGHKLVYHWQNSAGLTETDEWRSEEECESRTIMSKVIDRPHWIFHGWATSPNGSPNYQGGNRITVCDEVHLYAIWEYTYRPGMVMQNGTWMSCDRDGASGPLGRCNVLHNGTWYEMRTKTSSVGLDDPPTIHIGTWRVMKLIGQDGQPHDISWNCPHQWK